MARVLALMVGFALVLSIVAIGWALTRLSFRTESGPLPGESWEAAP